MFRHVGTTSIFYQHWEPARNLKQLLCIQAICWVIAHSLIYQDSEPWIIFSVYPLMLLCFGNFWDNLSLTQLTGLVLAEQYFIRKMEPHLHKGSHLPWSRTGPAPDKIPVARIQRRNPWLRITDGGIKWMRSAWFDQSVNHTIMHTLIGPLQEFCVECT